MMQKQNYDVLIVGSGPVGSTYARVIHDNAPTLRVLMVEEGPQVTTPAGRHVKTIPDAAELLAAQIASQGPDQFKYGSGSGTSRESDDAPVVARPGTFLLGSTAVMPGETGMPAAAMSANVGGMGSHWTCACPIPGDGERIPFIPRHEFDALLAESWNLLHVTQTAFDGAPFGQEIRDALGAVVNPGRSVDRVVQPMPLGITVDSDGDRYWTGPDVVLGTLSTDPPEEFELRSNTVALRVLHEDGRATGARLRDRETGEEYEVSANVVVVAGDALRTPQLLYASGVRPQALGHYLNEHPQVILLVQLYDSFKPADGDPTPSVAGKIDGLSGVSWIPYDKQNFPFHGQVMQLDTSPVPVEGVDEPWPGSVVGLGFFGTKDIQERDRLEFDETTHDFVGLPTIEIHYNYTEKDRAMFADATSRIRSLADSLGMVVGDRPPLIMPPGSSLHYMGTTRMGDVDDGTSVCDIDSRVWGYDNLYVGGNGVIPTPTACNPTSTSVALAIRGARSIVASLRQGNPE